MKKKKSDTTVSDGLEMDSVWKAIVSCSVEGIAVVDRKGNILYFNKAMTRLSGYTAEEAVSIAGWAAKVFPRANDRKKALTDWHNDFEAGKSQRREYIFRTKQGHNKCIAFKMFFLNDGLVAINGEDITEQRKEHVELMKTRFTVDHSSDAFYLMGPDARFIYVNDAACRALGYSRKKLLTMKVYDIDPNFPKNKWSAHWKEIRRKKSMVFESAHKTKSGELIPVEISINHQMFEDMEYNYAFARDISERKKTTEELHATNRQLKASEQQLAASEEQLRASNDELRASEARFRQLSEASFEGIVIHDNGIILHANKQFYEMTGYKPSELAGVNVVDKLIDPHARKDIMKRVKNNNTTSYETLGMRKDGTVYPAEIRIRIIDHQDRKIRVAAIRDITEQKNAQAKLAMLAAAVREAAESIMITDTNGNILYVNPCFEIMTGYKLAEVSGKNASILNSGRQDSDFYREMWKTISEGRVWTGQFTNRKKDGSLFEEDAVISPVRDASGAIVSYVAVKRDVTHETLLEDQVRQSQKMAAVGQLAHKIAHDFTNVLVVILGNAQLIKDNSKSPKLIQFIDPIISAANRISSLTADLLAFAHPAPLNLRVIRLSRAVAAVEEMLRRTIGPEINVVLDLQEDMGKVRIDPAQIAQVIIHLGINASEAMQDHGTLTISTRPANLTPKQLRHLQASVHPKYRHDGNFAVLSIKDTGCGMSREILSRIYEPFYTTKTAKHNSGLGLTTAYAIVEQHNGIITVDSQPGVGTTFRIYIPMVAE